MLFGICVNFAIAGLHETKAQTNDAECARIIQLIMELPYKKGQEGGDAWAELRRKARELKLNIEREGDRKFLNNLISVLADGNRSTLSFAASAAFELNFNSPELVQALDSALQNAEDPNCSSDACLFGSASAVDVICRTLSKKDHDHVRPRCKGFAFFFDQPGK